MEERELYDNALLTLRFVGPGFDRRGVNIYDFGNSLISLQRMINKAYLASQGRLIKGATPTKDERERLAFQVGQRKRASDGFAIIPVLTDPMVQQSLLKVLDWLIGGMVGYYVGDVLDRVKKEKNEDMRTLIASLYDEVETLSNRVNASGGVEAISIGSPANQHETVVAFTEDTKHYVKQIKNEYYLGAYQEIEGRVYKLYPTSRIIGIRRPGGSTVSVFLNDENFNKIRFTKENKANYIFKGHPKFKFGIETKSISDFDAFEIEFLPDDES